MSEFAQGPVSAIAISPDGQLVAAAAGDDSLAIGTRLPQADSADFKPLSTTGRLLIETPTISGLCFPGQTTVYTASSAGSFSRYAVSPSAPPVLEYTHADSHGIDGELSGIAAVSPSSIVVTCGKDAMVRCWDPETRQSVARLAGHKYEVRAVAVAQSGGDESGGEDVNIIASAGRDKTVRLWDVRTSDASPIHVFSGHAGWVHSVSISGGGPTRPHPIVVSCAGDKTVRVWNLATMRQELVLSGHEYRVWGVAVSADASFAISGSTDASVRAWNLSDSKDVSEQARCQVLEGHSDSVLCVAISRDGTLSASGCEDGSAYVWNTATLFGCNATRAEESLVNDDGSASQGSHAGDASAEMSEESANMATAKRVDINVVLPASSIAAPNIMPTAVAAEVAPQAAAAAETIDEATEYSARGSIEAAKVEAATAEHVSVECAALATAQALKLAEDAEDAAAEGAAQEKGNAVMEEYVNVIGKAHVTTDEAVAQDKAADDAAKMIAKAQAMIEDAAAQAKAAAAADVAEANIQLTALAREKDGKIEQLEQRLLAAEQLAISANARAVATEPVAIFSPADEDAKLHIDTVNERLVAISKRLDALLGA
jgi:WD40 repeat protein